MNEKLAIQRTKLANERTFLSYIRTSLVLLAAGATLIKFQSEDNLFLATAILLLTTGVGLAGFGYYMFRKNRKTILSGDG